MKDRNRFKGIVRKIIYKLRENGYAFNSAETVLDRKFKIAKIIKNDISLATAVSPILRNNQILRIVFTENNIKIYADIFYYKNSENNIKSGEVLSIIDINLSIIELVNMVGSIYQKYFYTEKEMFDVVDTLGIKGKEYKRNILLLKKLYNFLPLRSYERVCIDNEYIRTEFLFGSNIFSLKITHFRNSVLLRVEMMFYKNNGRIYTNLPIFNKLNSINKKYVQSVRDIININYLEDKDVCNLMMCVHKIKMYSAF